MRNSTTLLSRLAGGCTAACAFAFSVALPSIAAQKTNVVMYHAWTPAGKLANVRVTETVSGNCWTQSLVTSRGDAYRCMVGNSILDPCFAPKTSRPRAVACASDPFSNRIVLFRLKKPLPSSPNPTTQWLQPHNQPWGLRLTNGDTCDFATGATDVIKGERMNYQCSNDRWIIGLPNQLTPVWNVQSSAYPSKGVRTVLIAEAVF